VFEPHSLNVLTTNRCTASCGHCCMNSGPERSGELSGPQLVKLLGELLREAKQVQVVVFAGGEPLLLGEALHDGIRTVRAHGVVSRVVTNGYWATSLDEARRVVRGLRAAGLDEINISTDDHHLPYISLQRVRWAYEAACEAGFLSVAIAHCGGPQSALTAERLEASLGEGGAIDRRSQSAGGGDPDGSAGGAGVLPRGIDRRFAPDGFAIAPRRTSGQTRLVLSNANLQRIGRGVESIEDDALPEGVPDLAEYGGCPSALRSPAISPSGHLLACCGFELEGNPVLDHGDLQADAPGELLDAADNDLVTNLIAILGPPRLKDLLVRRWPEEVRFGRDYRSYCEVCWDLVHDPQNRAALLRHQGAFVELAVAVREQLRALWSNADGEVVLPVDLVVSPRPEDNEHAHARVVP
jgi:hypothetical protein